MGILFAYMRRFIDKKLDARDAETEERREQRLRKLKIEDAMEHATGRLFFYLHKAIVTGQHNGDLEEAWATYKKVEEEKKELDREILVKFELNE